MPPARGYRQLDVEMVGAQSAPDTPTGSSSLVPKLPNDGWVLPTDTPQERAKRMQTTVTVLGVVFAVIVVGAVASAVAGSGAGAGALPVVYGPPPAQPGAAPLAAAPSAEPQPEPWPVPSPEPSAQAHPSWTPAASPPPRVSGSTGDRDYGLAGAGAAGGAVYAAGNYSLDPTYVPCDLDELACGMVHAEPVEAQDFRGRERHAHGRRGLVAADSSRCSDVGVAVLDEGGNAADAAVAVALCQGVVNPIASGIGGGAFILVRPANGSAAEFINARETAPAAANATMFEGRGAYASLDGGLAVAVPMELRGLHELWRRHGSGGMPWARLVAPAAQLARLGFGAHPYLLYALSGPFNLARVRSHPPLREAFMIRTAAAPPAGSDAPDDGSGWRLPYPGELCCRRPALAATLEAVAANGAEWFYAPERAAVLAADIQAAGGIVTADDIAGAHAEVVPALTARLPGTELELLLPPPPSSAAVVAFALKFLAGYPAGAAPSGGPEAAAADLEAERQLAAHRLVEAQKHAFAVRTQLGDPGPAGAPQPLAANISAVVDALLDDAFADRMRGLTSDEHVLAAEAYGGEFNPLRAGLAPPPDDHGTTHFCVVDGERNAVSVTSTVNTVFGSGVVSPSLGVVLNNQMDDFSQPQRSGSPVTPHPSPANFIAPGKRPLSAMSPMVVTKAGELRAVAGASGGPLIVSATLQTLERLLLRGVGSEAAVAAPRVHDQLLPAPSAAYFEDYSWGAVEWRLPNGTREFLSRAGDELRAEAHGLGVAQLISVAARSGLLHGMSDARKDGAAAGLM